MLITGPYVRLRESDSIPVGESSMLRFLACTILAVSLLSATTAVADKVDKPEQTATTNRDSNDSWFYQPATQPTARSEKSIGRQNAIQKAQVRAQQRQDRLASLAWYGMSNSRPTASPTPFTGNYSPSWQGAGARPFVWYTAGRPTFVYR
jgi:hypothetical protein